jgi:hypothetical protein
MGWAERAAAAEKRRTILRADMGAIAPMVPIRGQGFKWGGKLSSQNNENCAHRRCMSG